MSPHLILRVVSKLLIPMIVVFGFYVQFHGDFGPGGGFQAGVIFAAGFVLYAMVFGVASAQRILPEGILRAGIAGGVLIYASVGLLGLILGENYLNYSPLSHVSKEGGSVKLPCLLNLNRLSTSIFSASSDCLEIYPSYLISFLIKFFIYFYRRGG